MANVNGFLSSTKFLNNNGDVVTALLRDNTSSHYLGRLNSDEAPTTATITLDGESSTITAKENDWIVLQTKQDAYIWNGSAWVQFGGGGSDREYQKVDVVNSINTATPSASAPTGTPIAYYSYDPLTSSLSLFQMAQAGSKVHDAIMEEAWVDKSWTGLTDFGGWNIWTDGENVYYSNYTGNQYVLNKSTSTWEEKTWSGFDSFGGDYIWTDGENVYCSDGTDQYVLDKSTSTWNEKTWTGLTDFGGNFIWSDGETVYYSQGSNQYVLDKSTSTWSVKSWTGLTNFNGLDIWSDGENVYYSYEGSNYVLDKSTSTWSTKSWTGLTSFDGRNIWTDGENTYYSYDGTNCVLDKATSTWNDKTWGGYTVYYGYMIWTDGETMYYSDETDQYQLIEK